MADHHGRPLTPVQRSSSQIRQTSGTPQPHAGQPGDPVLVRYTSGSPGALKAVERTQAADAVAAARRELAAEFTEDLRGIDTRIRDTRKKLAIAVRATGTSLTGLFGVGPVIAAAVIGDVRHVPRFPSRDHFAACNGTAPIEVSSGPRKVYRLSRRGNRRPATRSTWPRSPRSATGTAQAAPTTTKNWPRARPAKKRCAA